MISGSLLCQMLWGHLHSTVLLNLGRENALITCDPPRGVPGLADKTSTTGLAPSPTNLSKVVLCPLNLAGQMLFLVFSYVRIAQSFKIILVGLQTEYKSSWLTKSPVIAVVFIWSITNKEVLKCKTLSRTWDIINLLYGSLVSQITDSLIGLVLF